MDSLTNPELTDGPRSAPKGQNRAASQVKSAPLSGCAGMCHKSSQQHFPFSLLRMKSRHKADHGSDIRQILVGLGFTFFKLVKHIFMGRLVTHHASVLYNNVGFHTHYYFFS